MRSGRWGGGLFGRRWLLVLTVALLVGVPVLILGQASADDTAARLTKAQIESASHEADVVASGFNDRELLIQATLASLALKPTASGSPIALAVQRGDVATLQALADTVQLLYARDLLRTYLILRGDTERLNDGTVVVTSPAGTSLIGQRVSPLPLRICRRGCSESDFFQTGAVSDAFPGTADVPATENIVAILPGPGPDVQRRAIAGVAEIVAEVDIARLFAHTAAPSLAVGDDAYLVDGHQRLIARARAAAPFPLRDLSGDAFVQLIGPTAPAIARAGATDPLGAGTRLIASAPIVGPSSSAGGSWSVLIVRDTAEIDREVNGALSQLAIFRVAIVALLLGLAYMTGLAGSQVGVRAAYQERMRLARDLHDLLGHSLSLITIKSQLARRLIGPGETTRAADEIADIERVARESLDDVRRAVDGYRQPTFNSALASARAALAAAGIDGTIEVSNEPLPTAVDSALAWAIREGVTNVVRHSSAATCSIRVTREGPEIRLDITDDGPLPAISTPGNGLRGLYERAAARGGRVDAGPLPRGGFRLRMSLPL
jgi:signal transduction histidine kinase